MAKGRCPGANGFNNPKPDKEVMCPNEKYGNIMEFWTDEFVKECKKCKTLVSKDSKDVSCVFTCALWDDFNGACVPGLSKEIKDYINQERKKRNRKS